MLILSTSLVHVLVVIVFFVAGDFHTQHANTSQLTVLGAQLSLDLLQPQKERRRERVRERQKERRRERERERETERDKERRRVGFKRKLANVRKCERGI